MTPADLQAFLDHTQAESVATYLGASSRDDALEALEERLKWAAWHFRDAKYGWEAAFLLDHGQALRELLDEGEAAWWKRAEVTARPRRPERGGPRDWQAHHAFFTPGVAPPRQRLAPDDPPSVSPAPTGRRRASPETRPPPLDDIPEIPIEDLFADEEEDEFVGPKPPDPVDPEDQTDPIGFVAAPLPPGTRDSAENDHRKQAGLEDADTPVTIGLHRVADDDVTDPTGPRPIPRPPDRPPRARPTDPRLGMGVGLVLLGSAMLLCILIVFAGMALFRPHAAPSDARPAVEAPRTP